MFASYAHSTINVTMIVLWSELINIHPVNAMATQAEPDLCWNFNDKTTVNSSSEVLKWTKNEQNHAPVLFKFSRVQFATAFMPLLPGSTLCYITEIAPSDMTTAEILSLRHCRCARNVEIKFQASCHFISILALIELFNTCSRLACHVRVCREGNSMFRI